MSYRNPQLYNTLKDNNHSQNLYWEGKKIPSYTRLGFKENFDFYNSNIPFEIIQIYFQFCAKNGG